MAESIKNSRKEIIDHINGIIKAEEAAAKEKVTRIEAAYKAHIEEADKKVEALYEKAVKRRDSDYKYFEEDANKLTAGLEHTIVGLKKMNGYKDSLKLIEICEAKEKANREALEAEIAKRNAEREEKLAKNKSALLVTLGIELVLFFVASVINYFATTGGPSRYESFGNIIGEFIATAIVQFIITLPIVIPTVIAFVTAVKKDSISTKTALVARGISLLVIAIFGLLFFASAFLGDVSDFGHANWCFCSALQGLVPFITLFFKKKDE